MIEERQELMLPLQGNLIPKSRKAHFLKPTLNTTKAPLPKPPSSVYVPSKPNINHLKKTVFFRGGPKPQKNWDTWVNNLEHTHHETWKKVGIFTAVKASSYKIKRHDELIIALAEKWCHDTNTFVFSWGECSVTLEDVMVLGGFSVLGECVQNCDKSRETEEYENKLVSALRENRSGVSIHNVLHSDWMGCFMGCGGELEHMAFLVLWLSRYVFSTSYGFISAHVFPIAICLARGTRIALAPAVLASIYSDLTLLKAEIVDFVVKGGSDGGPKLCLWAPFQLVQLWVWERFPLIGPIPTSIVYGEPRFARWKNLKRQKLRCLDFDCESLGETFLWRPYALVVENLEMSEFYCDEERLVVLNSEVGEELLSFARCLRACELVGHAIGCIEQYLPHRVGLQFGMDQDVPSVVPRLNESLELAWGSYDKPLDGVMLRLSPRLVQGGMTVRYCDWWRSGFSCCDKERSSPRIDERSSLNLEASSEDRDMGGSICFYSCANVSRMSSVEKTNIATTLSCDRSASLNRCHVGECETMLSRSLMESEITVPQNIEQSAQDNNKDALPGIPSSLNNSMATGFVQGVGDIDTEVNPFVNMSMSPGRSHFDHCERTSCQHLEEVASGFVDCVEEMHVETSPCCDKINEALSFLPSLSDASIAYGYFNSEFETHIGATPSSDKSSNPSHQSMNTAIALSGDKITSPNKSHIGDYEAMPSQVTREPQIIPSQHLEANAEDNNMGPLPCLNLSSNACMTSGLLHSLGKKNIETTPTCDKSVRPSKLSQYVGTGTDGNSKDAPLCFPSSFNVSVSADFVHRDGEIKVEATPSCENRSSHSKSHFDNFQDMASQFPLSVDHEETRMDSPIAFVRCDEEMQVEATPSCQNRSNDSKSHVDNFQDRPSQFPPGVIHEASRMGSPIVQVEKHRKIDLNIVANVGTCISGEPSRRIQSPYDSGCADDQIVGEGEPLVEPAKKILCRVTTDDGKEKAPGYVNEILATGSLSDPVNIDDDKEGSGCNPFEQLFSRFDKRIRDLEREMSVKATKLGVQDKLRIWTDL